jgi:cytochrome oxidase assembly protein ShyY1
MTPKWMVRHVLVAALVVTMIALAFWQLRRLDEKEAYKALVEARQEEPAADVAAVVPLQAASGDPAVADVLYRTVTATGTYEIDDSVVVENRSYNSASGGWVLTPLRLDDGSAVVVNRGFIGFDRDGVIVAPDPPPGRVNVTGLVFPSQRRGSIGPRDPATGKLDVLARVDLDRYGAQVDYALLPAYIQLTTSHPTEITPPAGEPELVALGPPQPDLGPHLSYAVQWFIFTTIAAGGYALLLRRVARDQAKERAAGV